SLSMRGSDPEGRSGTDDTGAGVDAPGGTELVAGALARWRGSLVAQAGGSSLSDVSLLGEANLDFSTAHPSGVAQLFAGRPTRLSNLVREGVALSTARRRARAVAVRADDYAQRFGIAPTFLAIGVAPWPEENRDTHEEDVLDPSSDDVSVLAEVANPREDAPDTSAASPGEASPPAPDGAEPGRAESDGADRDRARSAVPAADGAPPDPAAPTVEGSPHGRPDPAHPAHRSTDRGASAASTGHAGVKPRTRTARRTFRAPVLLRPLTLQPRGSGAADYELVLASSAEVNPVLARALRAHGGLVDPVALARGTFTGSGFDPRPALERLAQVGRAVLS